MGHRIGPLGPFSAYREDASTGYAGNGPQVMATLRNIAVSLLYLAGITEITRTLQAISRDRNRVLGILPLQGFNEGAGSVQPSGRLDGLNPGPAVQGSCRFPHLTGLAARAAPPWRVRRFLRRKRLDAALAIIAAECRWLGQAGGPGRRPLPVRPEMAHVSVALMDLS